MQQVRLDEHGNVIDSNGNIVGKRVGDNIIHTKTQSRAPVVPPTLQQRIGLSNNKLLQQNVNESQQPKKQTYSSFNRQPTKYQVTKDSEFVVKFGLMQIDGRMVVVYRNYEQQKDVQRHWVKFRMWTYKQQLEWKDECMKFNMQSRSFILQTNLLNQKKLRNLIKDWSFAQISDRYKLLHTGGVLSDESYQVFKSLYPTIANAIIYLMNEVLQNNV